ncbi:unnamed protein product, partial [Protopolystoma xenopodis]
MATRFKRRKRRVMSSRQKLTAIELETAVLASDPMSYYEKDDRDHGSRSQKSSKSESLSGSNSARRRLQENKSEPHANRGNIKEENLESKIDMESEDRSVSISQDSGIQPEILSILDVNTLGENDIDADLDEEWIDAESEEDELRLEMEKELDRVRRLKAASVAKPQGEAAITRLASEVLSRQRQQEKNGENTSSIDPALLAGSSAQPARSNAVVFDSTA